MDRISTYGNNTGKRCGLLAIVLPAACLFALMLALNSSVAFADEVDSVEPSAAGDLGASSGQVADAEESVASEKPAKPKPTKPAKPKPVEITISAAGDCTLGIDSRYNSSFNQYYARHGDAYFLKKVKPIFKKDDLTIVNFEGTLTSGGTRADKAFTFRGPAKYVNILKKGSVEVANLANNHSLDFGQGALDNTKKVLKKNGIPYCIKGTIAYKKVKGVKVAFLGFDEVDGRVTKADIKAGIKKAKKAKASIVVVSFHWGIERDYYPNGTQKELGRYAIRCGASLVLGHHPHVLQGIEKYKDRYIVYSLGNFCFGGNTNPADKDTMIFQQTFTVKNGKLQKTNDAKVIPCSLSGSSSTNTFQPRVLTGSAKKSLIAKINRMSRGMHVKVTASGKIK